MIQILQGSGRSGRGYSVCCLIYFSFYLICDPSHRWVPWQTRGHWPTLKEQAAAIEQSEPENRWKWYRAITLRMNEYLVMHK